MSKAKQIIGFLLLVSLVFINNKNISASTSTLAWEGTPQSNNNVNNICYVRDVDFSNINSASITVQATMNDGGSSTSITGYAKFYAYNDNGELLKSAIFEKTMFGMGIQSVNTVLTLDLSDINEIGYFMLDIKGIYSGDKATALTHYTFSSGDIVINTFDSPQIGSTNLMQTNISEILFKRHNMM